jgi:hypothetical protein
LVSYSALDFLASLLPSAMLDPGWRSHATAQLGDSLASVLLGLFVVFAVAVLLHHRRTLRVLAVVCSALAMVCVASLVIRAWDYTEVGFWLTPQEVVDFGETTVVVTAKHMVALLLLCTLATIAWQSSPRAWRDRDEQARLPRDIFPRSERKPTKDARGGRQDVETAGVEPPDARDQRANPGAGDEDPPHKPFAAEEDETVALEDPPQTGGGTRPGKKGRRKSGKRPKSGGEIPRPPDDVLRSEVEALVETGESLTGARREVAARYGIGLSTVRRRTR